MVVTAHTPFVNTVDRTLFVTIPDALFVVVDAMLDSLNFNPPAMRALGGFVKMFTGVKPLAVTETDQVFAVPVQATSFEIVPLPFGTGTLTTGTNVSEYELVVCAVPPTRLINTPN